MKKRELEDEIARRCMIDEERKKSDLLYAKIIVQNIVFTMLGTLALGFLYSVLRTIWK